MHGPLICYQHDLTPPGISSTLLHCAMACCHQSQHWGLVLLSAASIRLLPGRETVPHCSHDCQGCMRRFEDATVMQARDEAFVANAAIRVGY